MPRKKSSTRITTNEIDEGAGRGPADPFGPRIAMEAVIATDQAIAAPKNRLLNTPRKQSKAPT